MQTINGFDCLKAFTLSLIGYPSISDKKVYAGFVDFLSCEKIQEIKYMEKK